MEHAQLQMALCILNDFGRIDEAVAAAQQRSAPVASDDGEGIHLYVIHGKQEPRPKLFVPRAMASAIRKKDRKASAGLCRFVANVETEMMRAQYDWPTPAILALKGRTGTSGGGEPVRDAVLQRARDTGEGGPRSGLRALFAVPPPRTTKKRRAARRQAPPSEEAAVHSSHAQPAARRSRILSRMTYSRASRSMPKRSAGGASVLASTAMSRSGPPRCCWREASS